MKNETTLLQEAIRQLELEVINISRYYEETGDEEAEKSYYTKLEELEDLLEKERQ